MDKARDKSADAVIEEASRWLVRLSAPEVSLKERLEFVAWLKRSPEHLAEYLRMERTWADLGQVDGVMSVAELLAADDRNVIDFDHAPPRPTERPPSKRFGAALAACAVLALAAVLAFQALAPRRYVTEVGEQRTIKLDDGSAVALNTNTELRVDYTDGLRRVNLLQGEALFTVANDPTRPFRVVSDRAVAQAIGTSFVVRRNADDTVVTVLEGQVAVARFDQVEQAGSREIPPEALHLAAGARADVLAQEIHTSAVPNLAAVTAWKSGRLIFEGEALSAVVAEFNRYNEVQLVLEDSTLSNERLSGVFDADKPQALVRFLERANVVEPAQVTAREIILTPRR